MITGSAQIVGTVFGGLGNDTIELAGAPRSTRDLGSDTYVRGAGETAVRCEIALAPPSA